MGNALGLAAAHAVSPGIGNVRNPGIHPFVLSRHPREDVLLLPVDGFQLAADPREKSVQFDPELGQHGFKLQLAEPVAGLKKHMTLQYRQFAL